MQSIIGDSSPAWNCGTGQNIFIGGMTMLARIATERKQKELIVKAISSKFKAYTTFDAEGHWENIPEDSIIIDIENLPFSVTFKQDVEEVAKLIKFFNRQETVMVSYFDTLVKFI
jgi:hypothetical protein